MNTVGWSLGYFRTQLSDDIVTVASPVQGRGFFINAGETLREGVEAAVNYRSSRLVAYASYAICQRHLPQCAGDRLSRRAGRRSLQRLHAGGR
jgi:hypothetical protein